MPLPTSTSAATSSSRVSSSYNSSSTATGTDTNLPSIPTVDYPTPSPTPVTNPKDHGVGAPFYLAVVLASISFIGCVSAFIAWWIRSRSRRRSLELDDPWSHHDANSDNGSFNGNANTFEKGGQTKAETQTRPYYLPASIVRRSSSDLLAVPHTIPASEPNPHQSAPSSKITNPYSRPDMERFRTGLSVQESTRTLGRLRVANRVPGDVTSGDEGGTNLPRLQTGVGLSVVASTGESEIVPVRDNVMRNTHPDQSGRLFQKGDSPMEPPGPATLSWGRRADAVPALRRSWRRTPETTVQTYRNARYGGYLYPTLGGTMSNQEDAKVQTNPPPDLLDWKNTLKTSFWQAVDAMTGNRPSDPEPGEVNAGSGSRFTPAPQRVASRRSPVSPIRAGTTPALPTARSQGTEIEYDLTPADKPVTTKEMFHDPTQPRVASFSTRKESETPRTNEVAVGRVNPPSARVSNLNHDLRASAHRRHPDSLRTDTGSVYSTGSAAARANLRKYGYGDPIPSSWSALQAARESQLDLERTYLPPPRPIWSSSPSPLSVTPSQLTLESSLASSSVSTRTRTCTPAPSQSDLVDSDASISRSGKSANTSSHGGSATGSTYSMSRNGTIQSGLGTIGHETTALHSHPLSTTSSMLSRKKGVSTRRKRPRLPPRAPSSASSVQSIESKQSVREVAVRRALLERRKKVKAAESLQGRESSLTRSHDASSSLV